MPKNTENLPITQDKPNISRKSLPLYKKVQYFVQGNRGWVVKTMGLFVAAILIVSLFLWQDHIFDNKSGIISRNQMDEIATPKEISPSGSYPISIKDYQITPEELAFIKSMENREYVDKENSGDKLIFDIVNILETNPPRGTIRVESSGDEYDVVIEPNTQITTVEIVLKKDGVINEIRYVPVDSNPLMLLHKDTTIGIFYSEPSSSGSASEIKANSIVYLGSKLEIN